MATNEVRQRSYRTGITLSGGESAAHFYMNLGANANVEVAMIEGMPGPDDGLAQSSYRKSKRKGRLTIVGRLQPTHDGSLFATEVDEDVLLEARTRLQEKFGLVTWEPKSVVVEKMSDIINPKVAYYLREAESSLTTNQPEKCLKILVRVIHLDKEGSASLECQMRFVALTELCDFQAAHIMATRTNFPPERLSWCFFAYGQSLMDVGLFGQALNAFVAASNLEPGRIEHKLKQIEALYRMRRYVECIGVVTELLRDNRGDKARRTDLYTLRARLQDLLSNVREVLNDIERALRIDPDHTGAKNFLQEFRQKANEMRDEAMVMYTKGRFREAADRLTTCMQTNPNNPDFYFKRGLVNRRLGDYRQAIDDLLESMAKMEAVAETDAIPPEALEESRKQLILLLNDMAVDCYRRKMYDDAIRLLERAIRFNNQEIAFYVNRGDCFYAMEDFDSALNDYEQANELAPSHEAITTRLVLVHSHRGLLAMRERNFADAENALSEAIKVRPHDYDLRVLRCRARLMLDRSRDACYDLIACLILNAPTNDPHIATLLPRLFPGKTAEEVMATEIGQVVFAEMGLRNMEAEAARLKTSTTHITSMSQISRIKIGTLSFSLDVAQLLSYRLLIQTEMHLLASDENREKWLKFAAKLAPRTTKWRGTSEGPLDRPLSRPGIARVNPDGQINLVHATKDSYSFRWKMADMSTFKSSRKKSPKKAPQSRQLQLNSATKDKKTA